jgi:hypothetical protein
VFAVAERPKQAAVEEIALADNAGELALLVYDRKVTDPSEGHQLLGKRQHLVALESRHLWGH